ncbi:MAG TPA: hypothetical protein PKD85_02475 [Saprospiraceae bacterium]|nr:hypothetical protein [Saprospiraceae bacterium]
MEEINDSYKPYLNLMKNYYSLYYLDYDDVVQLEKDFLEYAKYFTKMNNSINTYSAWSEEFKRIADRKEELIIKKDQKAKLYYDYKLVIDDEKINGYKLLKIGGDVNIMDFEEFKEWCVIWENHDITKEEFDKWLEKNLCSDWAKMDRKGKPYGGFWKYPEGSYEKENAYHLSYKDNILALHQLPYSRSIIIKTIERGCSNRNECVLYSNFMCEWVKRKKDVVFCNEIPSLQTLSRSKLYPGTALPPHLEISY